MTDYWLDGPGIEYRWRRDFSQLSRPTLGPTQSPVQWVPGLSWWVKSVRGVTLTPHSLLVPWSRKSRAIHLLPLWDPQPVQSLSVYTGVHFTFFYNKVPIQGCILPFFLQHFRMAPIKQFLGIQHKMHMCHIVICGLPHLYNIFPHYLKKGTIFFEGGGLEY